MRSPQLITVALGILLIIVLYTIPRRTPERITRYDEWLDTAMFSMPGDQLASLEETLDQLKSEKDGNRRADIYSDLAIRFDGEEWPQLSTYLEPPFHSRDEVMSSNKCLLNHILPSDT